MLSLVQGLHTPFAQQIWNLTAVAETGSKIVEPERRKKTERRKTESLFQTEKPHLDTYLTPISRTSKKQHITS